MQLYDCAINYLNAGLAVLPADKKQKRPLLSGWKQFQSRLPLESFVRYWFNKERDALCLVCGNVSGNLEVIDFDNHGELFRAWSDRISADLRAKLVIEQTPSGGYHVAYRSKEQVSTSVKLAQGERDGKMVTLIETRGEGGLILCAPGDGYTLLQGNYTQLPMLTAEERESLLEAARGLNERHEDKALTTLLQNFTMYEPRNCNFEKRPGDDFNERGDFEPLLREYGWRKLRTFSNGSQYWQRPGKQNNAQHSATLKDGIFYVFSTNAAPFEANRGYSLFTAFALLCHKGDFTAAAAELLKRGYGKEKEQPEVDFSVIPEKWEKADEPVEKEVPRWQKVTNSDIRNCLKNTMLGEIVAVYASVARPPLPLEGALLKAIINVACCLSGEASDEELNRIADGNLGSVTLIGPDRARLKINTAGGQLCNAYGMLVAESACGKDIGGIIGKFAHMVNPDLHHCPEDVSHDWNLGTAGSAEGIARLLCEKPNGLLCISELSKWLNKDCWQSKATEFLTDAFNSGYFEQNFSERNGKFATRKAQYCAPNIIGNIQPNAFQEWVAMIDIETGFLGRFLIAKMPEYYGNPKTFDSVALLKHLESLLQPFLRKRGVVNFEDGYSEKLQAEFIGKCDRRFIPTWRRLCNEYYPRFAVMLSVTKDPATQGEEVIITDEVLKKAELLVLWFFRNAEEVLSGILESTGNQRIFEKQLRRIFNIIKNRKEKGATRSTISRNASGSGTTSKIRQELLDELIERQWIMCDKNGIFFVKNPPSELLR